MGSLGAGAEKTGNPAPSFLPGHLGTLKSNHHQSIQGTFETALICPLLPLTFSLCVSLNSLFPLSLLLVPRWLGVTYIFSPNPPNTS